VERFFILHRRRPGIPGQHRFQMIRAPALLVSRRSILPNGNLATFVLTHWRANRRDDTSTPDAGKAPKHDYRQDLR
jgi:hypothetical protein